MEHEPSIDYRVYVHGRSLRLQSLHLKRNMKKTLLAIALCISPVVAAAAQTPVTTIDKFNSATITINNLREATNTKLGVIEANHPSRIDSYL